MRVKSLEELPLALRERLADPAPAKAPGSKYGAKAVVVNGHRYPSKLEAKCAEWLEWRRREGEIVWYARQPIFDLEGGTYRPDFIVAVVRPLVGLEVIDAKGHDHPAGRKSRRQMRERYGILVRLWPER